MASPNRDRRVDAPSSSPKGDKTAPQNLSSEVLLGTTKGRGIIDAVKDGWIRKWQVEQMKSCRDWMRAFLIIVRTMFQNNRPKIVRRIRLTVYRGELQVQMLQDTRCTLINPWMLEHHPPWKGMMREEGEDVVVCLIDMRHSDWSIHEAFEAIDRLGLVLAPDNAALWTLAMWEERSKLKPGVVDPATDWQDENGKQCYACINDYTAWHKATLCYPKRNKRGSHSLVLALCKPKP